MFEPKWPGASAFFVIGVGAVCFSKGDVFLSLGCIAIAVYDCFRYVKR